MDVLDGLSAKIPEEEQQPPPKKTAVVSSHRVSTAESNGRAPIVSTINAKPSANKKAPTTVAPVQPKKPPSVVASVAEEDKKMEATKRKLHKRYQEAEDAKRRRTVQEDSRDKLDLGMLNLLIGFRESESMPNVD
ncbi:hypothetical protein BAE44_0015435 [Dichanthelium oligosanthes]|uniref:No apical meristem-associated C-terminal domain-containing protein n=1 Tax=Dichanthelium oligosanthes TaxID=888268 RepID=A0A1E5VEH4_9POAL|nr:hypothetical protein BAE44_0015435 [Dichanthelium oligosanthes]